MTTILSRTLDECERENARAMRDAQWDNTPARMAYPSRATLTRRHNAALRECPGYAAIVTVGEQVLTNFACDLYITDRECLTAAPPDTAFVWGVRTTGTDLLTAPASPGALSWLDACLHANTWYTFDGHHLELIGPGSPAIRDRLVAFLTEPEPATVAA